MVGSVDGWMYWVDKWFGGSMIGWLSGLMGGWVGWLAEMLKTFSTSRSNSQQ